MSVRDIYVEIGREEYASLLCMMVQACIEKTTMPYDNFSYILAGALVRKRVEPSEDNLWKVANRLKERGHPLLTAFRAINESTPVLFKTPSVRYRQNSFPLSRPCTLGALAEIIKELTTNLRETMVAPWEWFFEWDGDVITFVPTLKHRYSCTLSVVTNREFLKVSSEEFTCTSMSTVTDKVHAAFDQLADMLEEVPTKLAGFLEATHANVTLHVYDLMPQMFRLQNLDDFYATWVKDRCE
jgi:hypothetical protein